MVNTTYRSDKPELMDDFFMEGEILRDALDKIAGINRLLGGNKVTIQGVEYLIRNHKNQEINILDIGCGNGDMLRALADYATKNHLNFKLTGIDANLFTVKHAQHLSMSYPDINYQCADIFEEIQKETAYDIVLCTLTLHHFNDQEILTLLQNIKEKARIGLVINDLHRSAIAYYLFTALCFVFRLNSMSKNDGLISILRGFKKHDLIHYSNQLNLKKDIIYWKWAFRYQWIIPTI